MSKSENQATTIYLIDDDQTIRKKIGKACTELPSSESAGGSEVIENLLQLLRLVSGSAADQAFQQAHQAKNLRFSDLKNELAGGIISFISPIRGEVAEDIKNNESDLRQVMDQEAEKPG